MSVLDGALGAALVLVVAASGSGDYVLTMPDGEEICAKSRDACELAREAIRTERWPVVAPDAATACRPHPACFPPSSLTIRGYNDK